METLDRYRFEIPVAALRSSAEQVQHDVTALHAIEDPTERGNHAQDLFIDLRLRDGTSVMDTIFAAMDQMEVPDVEVRPSEAALAEAEAQAQRVIAGLTEVIIFKGHPGRFPLPVKPKQVDSIQLEVTPGGDLAELSYISRIAPDAAATARDMRMSRRAPSGPTGGVVVRIPNAMPGKHIR